MAHRDYVHHEDDGDGIVIHWDSNVCAHAGVCFRSLPDVFRPRKRPWVDPDAAGTDAIEAAVAACPSHALTSTRFKAGETPPLQGPADIDDDGADGPTVLPTTVKVLPRGPYLLKGTIEVIDGNGEVARRTRLVALCRCGESKTKPFCDGSHYLAGFEDEGHVLPEN